MPANDSFSPRRARLFRVFPHSKNDLIIKILQQQRHADMDCRYPDYMDVMLHAFPGVWVPAIHAGTTNLLHLLKHLANQVKI